MVVDFRTLCICPIHSNNAHGLDKTNCCPFSTGQQFRPSTSPIPCLRHSFHPTRPHSPLRSTSNAHVYPNLNCHLLPFPRRPSTSAMQAPTTSTQGSQALGPHVPQPNSATPSGPAPSLLTVSPSPGNVSGPPSAAASSATLRSHATRSGGNQTPQDVTEKHRMAICDAWIDAEGEIPVSLGIDRLALDCQPISIRSSTKMMRPP